MLPSDVRTDVVRDDASARADDRAGGAEHTTMTVRPSPPSPASHAPRTAPDDAWRVPLQAWIVSRALVIASAIVASVWLGPPPRGSFAWVPRWASLLGTWDYWGYFSIARHGYQSTAHGVTTHLTNYAFFPLLPWLMRIGIATATSPFIWGLCASNLGFLAGLIAFHRLSADFGTPRFARIATWIAACGPAAVYASLAYTDGILFGLAACAALAATRRRWLVAGMLCVPAALARPQGVFVAVMVAAIALSISDVRWPQRIRWALVGGLPGAAALVAFLGWLQVAHGSWSLNLRSEIPWGRAAPGLPALRSLWSQITYVATYPADHPWSQVTNLELLSSKVWADHLRDVCAVAVCLVLIVGLWRMNGPWRVAWTVFSALVVIGPLASGIFDSELRFSLVAFPLVWPVAKWVEAGSVRRCVGIAAAAAPLALALIFLMHFASP